MKNKNQKGVWIDGSRALVITLKDGKEAVHEIPSQIENRVHHNNHQGDKGSFIGHQHINHEKKFHEKRKHEESRFLEKVVDEVKDADEIYLMGPAELKIRLRSRIEADHTLSKRLLGVEAADQLTLNQCVAKVKRFYMNCSQPEKEKGLSRLLKS